MTRCKLLPGVVAGLVLFVATGARGQEIALRWLAAPSVHQVTVCASFLGWRCQALVRRADGQFVGHFVLRPGLYEYGFRVDGRWRLGRHADHVPDGFGGQNDLLRVSGVTH